MKSQLVCLEASTVIRNFNDLRENQKQDVLDFRRSLQQEFGKEKQEWKPCLIRMKSGEGCVPQIRGY
jgi:hypothetical protein